MNAVEMITVTYTFQIPAEDSATAAASNFCNSVTHGTWTDLHAKSSKFSELSRPILLDLDTRKDPDNSSQSVSLKFSFSASNVDPIYGGIPSLLNIVAGDIFELRRFRNTRLVDIEFPETYLAQFPGPRYGTELASILTCKDGAIPYGAIVKPRLGLSPDECAHLAYMAAKGGAHFIKDDEIMLNPSYCLLAERTRAICNNLDNGWRLWKRKTPFYCNVSGRPDKVLELAAQASEAGAQGLYVNAITSGFSSLRHLREQIESPLIAGRDMYTLLNRSDGSGISLPVLGKLARMAGADMFFVGSVAGKLRNEILEIQALVRVLTQDRLGSLRATLPLVSCGVHPGNVHLNIALLGTKIAFQAGGGIHGHPKGSLDGSRAMRAAIALAERGIPIEAYEGHRGAKSLALALEKWNIFSVSDSIRGLTVADFNNA